MNIDWLDDFLALVEVGGFARAAEQRAAAAEMRASAPWKSGRITCSRFIGAPCRSAPASLHSHVTVGGSAAGLAARDIAASRRVACILRSCALVQLV